MSKPRTIHFPQQGVREDAAYSQQPPYAALDAVNVRGQDAIETRWRGGSRPGLRNVFTESLPDRVQLLQPINYIDASGQAVSDVIAVAGGGLYRLYPSDAIESSVALKDESGNVLLGESGEALTYTATTEGWLSSYIGASTATAATVRGNTVYLVGVTGIQTYSPVNNTLCDVSATNGVIPDGCTVITQWRDRIALAGSDNMVYASRTGRPTDFDFGGDRGDISQAVAHAVTTAGRINEKITALIPLDDRTMLVATKHTLWILGGDSALGQIQRVSQYAGVISSTSWCYLDGGAVAFMSVDGLCLYAEGIVQPFSSAPIPRRLRNIRASENRVLMAYDYPAKGIHLFVTPDSGTGMHYFIDMQQKAFWPVRLPQAMQPTSVCEYAQGRLLLGCRDGGGRAFSSESGSDDGVGVKSYVLCGPMRVSSGDTRDGLFTELHGILPPGSEVVKWWLFVADTAQEAAQKAKSAMDSSIDGGAPHGFAASGAWSGGKNQIDRPRARGAWCVLMLGGGDTGGRWGFESGAMQVKTNGRLR